MKKELDISINQNIKKLRLWMDVSQKTLAHRASMTQTQLSKIESGKDLPFSKVQQLAKALGVSVVDLISLDSKIVFNQTGKKNNGIVINNSSSENEMLELLQELKKENAFLRRMLEATLGKKAIKKK